MRKPGEIKELLSKAYWGACKVMKKSKYHSKFINLIFLILIMNYQIKLTILV